MLRERLTLSHFEKVFHGRQNKKVTLISEIEDCFKYFDTHAPKMSQNESLILIHGSKVEIKKLPEGKGYSVEMDGVARVVGKEEISKQEQMAMVRKIRSITIPYAEHVKSKQKHT